MKTGSKKEVSTLQGHGRKRDSFQGLAGNFLYGLSKEIVSEAVTEIKALFSSHPVNAKTQNFAKESC